MSVKTGYKKTKLNSVFSRTYKLFLLVFSFFAIFTKNVFGKTNRIVGGKQVEKGQFPFFAQLVIGYKM